VAASIPSIPLVPNVPVPVVVKLLAPRSRAAVAPVYVTGVRTEQLVLPGAQVGVRVSPGVYLLAGGVANT